MVSLVPQQSTLGETHRLLPGSEDEHWHRIAGVAVDNILLKARMQQHSLTSLEAPPPIAAPACSPPSVQSTGLASNGHFLSPNLSSVGADGQPSAPLSGAAHPSYAVPETFLPWEKHSSVPHRSDANVRAESFAAG